MMKQMYCGDQKKRPNRLNNSQSREETEQTAHSMSHPPHREQYGFILFILRSRTTVQSEKQHRNTPGKAQTDKCSTEGERVGESIVVLFTVQISHAQTNRAPASVILIL